MRTPLPKQPGCLAFLHFERIVETRVTSPLSPPRWFHLEVKSPCQSCCWRRRNVLLNDDPRPNVITPTSERLQHWLMHRGSLTQQAGAAVRLSLIRSPPQHILGFFTVALWVFELWKPCWNWENKLHSPRKVFSGCDQDLAKKYRRHQRGSLHFDNFGKGGWGFLFGAYNGSWRHAAHSSSSNEVLHSFTTITRCCEMAWRGQMRWDGLVQVIQWTSEIATPVLQASHRSHSWTHLRTQICTGFF